MNPDINDFETFDSKFRRLQENRSNFSKSCELKPYNTNGPNNVIQNNLSNELLKGQLCSSKLSQHFFSKCNLDHLQNLLIQNIYKLSNKKYKIGRQSDKELLVIMRHIYMNEAKNRDTNIIEQVNVLNNSIIEKIIPSLLSNIIQQQEYLKKISNPLLIMEPPINVSSSNTRTTLEGSSRRLF